MGKRTEPQTAYDRKITTSFLLTLIIAVEERDAKRAIWKRLGARIVPRSYLVRWRRRTKFGTDEYIFNNREKLQKAIDEAYLKMNE